MKKRALPLLLAVLLCLTGCGSFLQREWYEVKDHSSSYYEGSAAACCRPTPIRIW